MPKKWKSNLAEYLGTCWERIERADGTKEVAKLHLWLDRSGERHFALSEADARAHVAACLAA